MNIYLLDVTSIPEQAVSEYTYALDTDRQNRIAQYSRSAEKRRSSGAEKHRSPSAEKQRSFGAGMALLYAWRMQYKDRVIPQTARDENGKPYFIGERIPFCLSHSGKYAACVLAEKPDQELGLDIQEPRTVRDGVTARFFSEGENEQVRAGVDPCLIWSRKESLAKYRGSGLRGDLRLLDTAGKTEHIWSCRTADDYAVSVCTEKAVECRLVYLTWEQVKGIL